LTRYSTAISLAGVPAAMSSAHRAAPGRLGRLVVVLGEQRLGTGRPLRDQLEPGVAAGGLGDDAVGQPDDLRGGPVVAHQPDLGRPGEALAEAEQVVRRAPGEAVDRLLRVADDAQVVAAAEPGVEQPLLQRGDVLVLVDDERAVAEPELLATTAFSSSARPSAAAGRRSRPPPGWTSGRRRPRRPARHGRVVRPLAAGPGRGAG
jgi:fructose-specific component phosphotransferase system IIB-like protein